MFLCLPLHWRPVLGSLSMLFATTGKVHPRCGKWWSRDHPMSRKTQRQSASETNKNSPCERERRSKAKTKRRKKQVAQSARDAGARLGGRHYRTHTQHTHTHTQTTNRRVGALVAAESLSKKKKKKKEKKKKKTARRALRWTSASRGRKLTWWTVWGRDELGHTIESN